MLLVLFRHGPAGDPAAWRAAGMDDAERPLEDPKKTKEAAKGLSRLLDGLDLIVSSPLLRAKQTADALAKRFPAAERLERGVLSPAEDPKKTERWLRSLKRGSVALVGHEPHLSRLAALVLGGKTEPFLELKKAGAALIDFKARRLLALYPAGVLRRLCR